VKLNEERKDRICTARNAHKLSNVSFHDSLKHLSKHNLVFLNEIKFDKSL